MGPHSGPRTTGQAAADTGGFRECPSKVDVILRPFDVMLMNVQSTSTTRTNLKFLFECKGFCLSDCNYIKTIIDDRRAIALGTNEHFGMIGSVRGIKHLLRKQRLQ